MVTSGRDPTLQFVWIFDQKVIWGHVVNWKSYFLTSTVPVYQTLQDSDLLWGALTHKATKQMDHMITRGRMGN